MSSVGKVFSWPGFAKFGAGAVEERSDTPALSGGLFSTLAKAMLVSVSASISAVVGVWLCPIKGVDDSIVMTAVVLAALYGGLAAGLLTVLLASVGTVLLLPGWAQPWGGNLPPTLFVVLSGATALITARVNAKRNQVTAQLQTVKKDLEAKVERRTSELGSAVTRLRREIEHRKRTEEELRSVAGHTRCILWQALVTSAEKPSNGSDAGRCLNWKVTVQDEDAAQLVLPLEVSPGDSYYKAWASSRHADDALAVGRTCTEAVFAEKSGYSHEYRCFDKDGQVRWLAEDVRIHRVAPGKWYLFGVTTDVTQSKRAAEALRASEERFALFMEHLPGLAFIKDEAGRYVYMNKACEERFGLTRAQWVEKTDAQLHPRELAEQFAAGERRMSRSGGSLQSLEVVPGPHGERRYFVFTRFGITSAVGGSGLRGTVAIDITERRQAEEALIEYQEKLRALAAKASNAEERERRQIAAALHDHIGGTLAAAQIRLQMLQLQPDGPAFSHAARKTIQEVVGDVSDAIKQTRSLTCELSPPLLYDLGLSAAVRWLAEQITSRHGIRVEVVDDAAVEDLDQEKKVALYQGARELLTNVVKHANAKSAAVTLSAAGGYVTVSVSDDGVGINSRATRETNSFGLFNLRERLNFLGGRLIFQAEHGKGTKAAMVVVRDAGLTAGAPEGSDPLRQTTNAPAA